MLVGVLSDSHDNLPKLREAVALLRDRGAEHLIHAGDFVAPFAVNILVECGVPFTGVFGNNDGEKAGIGTLTPDVHEPPHAFELGGRRIVVVHDPAKLPEGLWRDADVVVCGHTHLPAVTGTGPLVVNPGECGGWVMGTCTVAVLDLDALEASIVEV